MLSANTSTRRRQYGRTNRRARPRSAVTLAGLQPHSPPSTREKAFSAISACSAVQSLSGRRVRDLRRRTREHEQLGSHVAVERNRAEVLIGVGVVEIDGI